MSNSHGSTFDHFENDLEALGELADSILHKQTLNKQENPILTHPMANLAHGKDGTLHSKHTFKSNINSKTNNNGK